MQKVIIRGKKVHSPEEQGYIQLFQRGEFVKMNSFSVRNSVKQTVEVKLENGNIITVLLSDIDFVNEYPQEIFIPYGQE